MVEHYLRCYTTHLTLQDNWASLLPVAMLAINNRNATSAGVSPFFLTHGYNVDLLDLAKGQEELRTNWKFPSGPWGSFCRQTQGSGGSGASRDGHRPGAVNKQNPTNLLPNRQSHKRKDRTPAVIIRKVQHGGSIDKLRY